MMARPTNARGSNESWEWLDCPSGTKARASSAAHDIAGELVSAEKTGASLRYVGADFSGSADLGFSLAWDEFPVTGEDAEFFRAARYYRLALRAQGTAKAADPRTFREQARLRAAGVLGLPDDETSMRDAIERLLTVAETELGSPAPSSRS